MEEEGLICVICGREVFDLEECVEVLEDGHCLCSWICFDDYYGR
jgi:hypothetical protein